MRVVAMNAESLPGQQEYREQIICPSCGRFVGPLTRCPYCGARIRKRLSVRLFRYLALLLATVGLFFLYLMATHREVPRIRVGDIRPTMNFAYVRVAGLVSSDARIYREGDAVRSLRFTVDDGSGEIPVTAYRAQARELVASGRVPRMGDKVEVAGSLSVAADDRVMMRLQSPDQLILTRAELPLMPLGSVSTNDVGRSIMVKGVISDIRAPRPNSRAPWLIRVSDSSGEKGISFWDDTYAEIADKDRLVPGAAVRARVSVGTFRGRVQLRLASGRDLEFLQGEEAAAVSAGVRPEGRYERTPISALKPSMVGREVEVSGRVLDVRPPREGSRAPWRVVLEEDGAQVMVVYWDKVARHLRAKRPEKGAYLVVRGRLAVYRGRLQLKVSNSRDIELTRAPQHAPDAGSGGGGILPIAKITPEMKGRIVRVRGILGQARSIPGGVVYQLKDDSGEIKVVLWDRFVSGEARDALDTGRRVRVSGKVSEYHGQLEIVPQGAYQVVVEDGGE